MPRQPTTVVRVADDQLAEAMAANIDKLRKRWPDGFGVGG